MITIRNAALSDAARLVEIYDYYVRNTAVTFEYDTPSVDDFQARMSHIMEFYPYLVLLKNGSILGYAYAGTFKDRKAYDWSCETTIYIDRDSRNCGFGRLLYEALETELAKMGILNLYACVGYPESEDKYLTFDSARFHEHLGYRIVGTIYKCGYKFDTWYHMVWMEKIIGEHSAKQPPVQNAFSVRD